MSRFDNIGLFWEDRPKVNKRGERVLGPLPPIPETGWLPPTELPDITGAKVIALDTETYDPGLDNYGPGWARNQGHMCGFSVAVDGGKWYFPIRHTVQSELNMDERRVLQWAKHFLETPKIPKVGANLIYDIGWFRHEGINVQGELHDCQFAEALLNESSKVALDILGQKYCGTGKEVDVLKDWCINYYGGKKTKWRANIYRAPITLVGAYGEQDAALPLQVIQKQWPLLQAQGLLDLYRMECELIPLLVDMRYEGVSIDLDYTDALYSEFDHSAKQYQQKLNDLAGFGINSNSGADISRAFDKHGLTYPRTAAGAPSFVKEFLENHEHPIAQAITDLRGAVKLRDTFVKGYMQESHVNGKVYGSFHPLSGTDGGAKTGRFASSKPNLQNIPTRTAEGKKIRRAFIPDEGHDHWRKYDFSQIEYRFLAHFAVGEGSNTIRSRYQNDPNTDYHASTGELIKQLTGIDLDRGKTKNINFGSVYGLGIENLAKKLGVSLAVAKQLLKDYHEGLPFVKKTMEMLEEFTKDTGYNLTILGRRTRFDLWEPDDWSRRKALPLEAARREYGHNIRRAYLYRTMNYTMQGSSADQMKKAMLNNYKAGVFDVTGVPRLTVHDELDFSVKDRSPRTEEAFREMRHNMEQAIQLRVPVICDVESGPNWGDVKEV